MECDFSAVLWVDFVAVMRVMAYQGNELCCHICECYHWAVTCPDSQSAAVIVQC